jgi:hypothetical protein
MVSDILDQWEAEAKECVKHSGSGNIYLPEQRILSLIDLVRRKDEALEFSNHVLTSRDCSSDQTGHLFSEWRTKMRKKIEEALSLTEKLGEK